MLTGPRTRAPPEGHRQRADDPGPTRQALGQGQRIDRSLSKAKLETRFGLFEAPSADLLQTIKSTQRYTAAPLQVNPERDGLYQNFLSEIAVRRSSLEAINQDGARLHETHQAKWTQKRRDFERLPMLKHDRQRTRLLLKQQEQGELATLRTKVAARRNAVRAERPYTTWNSYLQHLAAQGHETALAILRSPKGEVQPEAAAPAPKTTTAPHAAGQTWAEQREKILNTPGISDRHRRALLTVVKMRELLERKLRLAAHPRNSHSESTPKARSSSPCPAAPSATPAVRSISTPMMNM